MKLEKENKVIQFSDHHDEEFDALLFAALSKEAEEEILAELAKAEELELPESLNEKIQNFIKEENKNKEDKVIDLKKDRNGGKDKILKKLGSRRFNSMAAAVVVLLIGVFGFKLFMAPMESAHTEAVMSDGAAVGVAEAAAAPMQMERAVETAPKMKAANGSAALENAEAAEDTMDTEDICMYAASENEMPAVAAVYFEDAEAAGLGKGTDYEEFVLESGEYESKIVIYTDTAVKDLKLLSVNLTDVNADGKAVFEQKELYAMDSLAPDRPLLVTLVFHGDLPEYGVSYVDGNGDTRTLLLTQSGYDGSLLLTEE